MAQGPVLLCADNVNLEWPLMMEMEHILCVKQLFFFLSKYHTQREAQLGA